MIALLLCYTLTLNSAIERGLEYSPDIKMLKYNLEISKKTNSYNYSSLLPSITSTGGRTKSYPGGYENYFANFTLSQSLSPYTFLNGVNAHFKNTFAFSNYLEGVNNTIFQIIQYYLNAYTLKRLKLVSEKRWNKAKENLDKIKEMFKLGSASKADLLKAEVDESQAYLNFLKAKSNLRSSILQLKNAILIPLSDSLELSSPSLNFVVPSLDSLKALSEKNRPRLIAAYSDVNSARTELISDISNYLPRFSISGSYGYAGRQFPDTKEIWDNNDSYSIGINLSMDIFTGFKKVNTSIINKMKLSSAEWSLKKERAEVEMEVEDAYYSYIEAKTQVDVAKKGLKLAEESETATKERYELGEASVIELLSGEADLLDAQYNYENAKKAYILSIYNIKKAVGKILE